jgi:hypothetical protein
MKEIHIIRPLLNIVQKTILSIMYAVHNYNISRKGIRQSDNELMK